MSAFFRKIILPFLLRESPQSFGKGDDGDVFKQHILLARRMHRPCTNDIPPVAFEFSSYAADVKARSRNSARIVHVSAEAVST